VNQLFIATAFLGASMAFAQQSNTVTLTEVESAKIEAANLKLQNLQLQFQLTQAQLQKLQEQYPVIQKELGDATEAARKAHGLADNAALSQDGKSFVVPTNPSATPAKETEKK
jgi:hypothetical protein